LAWSAGLVSAEEGTPSMTTGHLLRRDTTMFEVFRSASDDQIALLGSAAALIGSAFLMYVSYFLGPMARQERAQQIELLVRQRQQLLERNTELPRDKAA
jgi:hypothetical protein